MHQGLLWWRPWWAGEQQAPRLHEWRAACFIELQALDGASVGLSSLFRLPAQQRCCLKGLWLITETLSSRSGSWTGLLQWSDLRQSAPKYLIRARSCDQAGIEAVPKPELCMLRNLPRFHCCAPETCWCCLQALEWQQSATCCTSSPFCLTWRTTTQIRHGCGASPWC